MKVSWTALKVSIAGAKLSHMVQKDRIWDHGSMVEQVRNIFYLVERAKNKNETETVQKCLTANGFEKLKAKMGAAEKSRSFLRNVVLTEISILHVSPAKKEKPDCFKALIKGKRKTENDERNTIGKKENYGIEKFSEEWFFIRQGEWWLLDEMKTKRPLFQY